MLATELGAKVMAIWMIRDTRGRTLLHTACRPGQEKGSEPKSVQIVRILVRHLVKLNVPKQAKASLLNAIDDNGLTACMMAVSHPALVRALIYKTEESGLDLNVLASQMWLTGVFPETALDMATNGRYTLNIEYQKTADILRAAGAKHFREIFLSDTCLSVVCASIGACVVSMSVVTKASAASVFSFIFLFCFMHFRKIVLFDWDLSCPMIACLLAAYTSNQVLQILFQVFDTEVFVFLVLFMTILARDLDIGMPVAATLFAAFSFGQAIRATVDAYYFPKVFISLFLLLAILVVYKLLFAHYYGKSRSWDILALVFIVAIGLMVLLARL